MVKTTRITKTFHNLKPLIPLFLGIIFLIYIAVLGVYTYRNYATTQLQILNSEHDLVVSQYNAYNVQFQSSASTFLKDQSNSLLQSENNLTDFDALNERETRLSDQALMLSTAMQNYDNKYATLKNEDQTRSDLHKVYTSLVDDSYTYQAYKKLEEKIYSCYGNIKLTTSNNRLTSSINSCFQYSSEITKIIDTVGRANLSSTNEYWKSYFDYWNYIEIVYTSNNKSKVLKLEETVKDKYKTLKTKKNQSDNELYYNFKGKYLEIISSF